MIPLMLALDHGSLANVGALLERYALAGGNPEVDSSVKIGQGNAAEKIDVEI